jgi:CDP-diglyceride synthetase
VAIASGLAVGLVALLAFHFGPVVSTVLITVVVTLAVAEFYAALRRAGERPATLLGIIATVSLMVGTYNKGIVAFPLVTVMLVAFTMLWYVAGVERFDPVRGTALTLFGFGWVGFFGSFAELLVNQHLFPDRHGIAFLLGAIICVVAYDIGALAVGAWIGHRPLAPNVSPNKTWEGLVGASVITLIVSVIVLHEIHPWTTPKAVLLGLVVIVLAPLGDLCESMLKRTLGMKDMGGVMPGHGGLLDRVDGLLFVLPALYYLVKAVHLG